MTKTLTFAVMHFTIAFAVAYVLTGSLVVGGAVALVEPAVNTLGFYVHEKIWAALTDAGTGTKAGAKPAGPGLAGFMTASAR
jgi:uncharacterized membrane protein